LSVASNGAEAGLATHDLTAADQDLPLVSIITSVLNGAATLEKALASVAAQTYPRIEYLVIDAASTDGTPEILARHGDQLAYWVSEPDAGIYDAWNKGLRQARGQWVMFLGADDQLPPDAVAALVAAAQARGEDLDFVMGQVALYRGATHLRTIGRPWDWHLFRKYMSIAHTGGLHAMAYFRRHGLFDPSYRIAGDYELLLRAGPGLRTLFVPVVVAEMQVGGASNRSTAVFHEWQRAKDLHGVQPAWLNAWDARWAMAKWRLKRWLNLGGGA